MGGVRTDLSFIFFPATHPPSRSPLCLSRGPELLLIHLATGGLPLGSPEREGTGLRGRVRSVPFPAVPAPVRVTREHSVDVCFMDG